MVVVVVAVSTALVAQSRVWSRGKKNDELQEWTLTDHRRRVARMSSAAPRPLLMSTVLT